MNYWCQLDRLQDQSSTAGGALLLYLNDTKEVLIENIVKLELSNIITAEK